MKRLKTIICSIIIMGDIFPCCCFAETINVKVGILAYRGGKNCVSRWQPTINYLSNNIERYTFELVPLEFDAVNPAVEKKEIDFILVNSSMYITISRKYKVSPIATLETLYKGKAYNIFGGVIFTRKNNSKINHLDDLANSNFVGVKESSFGGWQMVCYTMKQNGFDPYKQLKTLSFAQTHDAAVLAVRDGKADAGTVRTDILEKMADEGKIKLNDFKIINKKNYSSKRFPFLCSTSLYPEWPFSRLEHVDPELGKKVAIALMKISSNSIPAQTARIAGWSPPLNYIEVEKCLQALRVGPFVNYERVTFKKIWRDHPVEFILSFAFLVLIGAFTIFVVVMNGKMRQAATARKMELAERRRAEREMRQIFNYSGDGMRVLSNKEITLQVNEQYLKMLGYDRAEIEGQGCVEFCHCNDACNTEKCILNQVKKSERIECDITLKKKDGTTVPTIMTAVPYYNVEGEVIGTIQIFKDITDRIEAQKQAALQAEQHGKIEISSSILHDIGNAVTGMGSLAIGHMGAVTWPESDSLDMLQKMFTEKSSEIDQALGVGKAQKIQIFINKLKQALVARKKSLDDTFARLSNAISHVNDVLTLQRMYANPNIGKPVLTNPIDLVQDSLSMLSASIQKRKITVNTQFDDNIPDIKLDKTRIIQVIINILKNACESFDLCEENKSRKLDIVISKETENIKIMISDNAAGLSMEQAVGIFENGFTTKKNGSGIGLYQCKSIIESHNGSIDFSSDGLGYGATLTITLPIGN